MNRLFDLRKKKSKRNSKNIKLQLRMKNPLQQLLSEYDYLIVLLVILFTIFGVCMVFSAGYYYTVTTSANPYYFLIRQAAFACTGFVIMIAAAKFDYHRYESFAVPALVISIVLLALLETPLGVTVNYATRWISVLGFRITPSEISKLSMIIFTSVFLAARPERVRNFSRGLLPLFIIMFIHAALIIKQPNLSTAVVICLIMIGIMFVAGLNIGWIFFFAGNIAAGAVLILLKFKNSHWYARLTNWTDPFKDSQGYGYQLAQSIIALGTGGLKGRGIGNSVAKYLYLPEPQNDFILAVIGEEIGFIGIMIILIFYILLIWRCFMVAAKATDKLGFYLASGVAIMLGLQVIINVAVVTGSMPTTGITLPFISYGGTSLWVFMASIGIVLNISGKEQYQ